MKAARSPVKASIRALRTLVRDSRGATAVEYGLILALVVLTMITALTHVADVTVTMWNTTATKVAAAR